MARLKAHERQLLDLLRHDLISWANSGAPFVLLGVSPQIIGTNKITEQPFEPLPIFKGRGSELYIRVWRQKNLNSMSVPYLGCVIDGEADIVSITTTEMCHRYKTTGKRWVINSPRRTFLLTPPHVPISAGDTPHWEGENIEGAYSRILWMQFHATGISWHICTSDQGKHWTHPHYFLAGTEFLPIAWKLIAEMELQPSQYLPVVYHYLALLFQFMVRGLLSTSLDKSETEIVLPHSNSHSEITQRAIVFIDANFNVHALNVEQIATHVQVSSRHLARIFKRDVGTTIFAYITERRLQAACQYLRESQYNIAKVAGNIGYATAASFIKVFKRHFNISPTDYRKSQKNMS